jgi:hypothetical protein
LTIGFKLFVAGGVVDVQSISAMRSMADRSSRSEIWIGVASLREGRGGVVEPNSRRVEDERVGVPANPPNKIRS